MPGERAVQRSIFQGLVLNKRMNIILPENTVQASSDEPRVKNQRAETAAAVSCGADGMENAGVDKKALLLGEGKAVRCGTEKGVSFCDNENLQVFMPVSCYRT